MMASSLVAQVQPHFGPQLSPAVAVICVRGDEGVGWGAGSPMK